MRLLFIIAAITLSTPCFSQVKVILDTDMGTDCDDAGAIAMLIQYESQGLCRLIGITYETTNAYGPKAISSILNYFSRPDVLIGTNLPSGYWSGGYGYARYLATNFPNSFDSTSHQDSVTLLRCILSTNIGVKIVTIGQQRNLNQLFFSTPDSISPLTGMQLLSNSVSEVVVMGGDYPLGNEHNFTTDPSQVVWINSNNIVPMTFIGSTIGYHYPVYGLIRTNLSSPIGYAFNNVMGGFTQHASWDMLAVLYAVKGLSNYFGFVTNGFVYGDRNTGGNSWQTKAILPQKYLTALMDTNSMRTELDGVLLLPPPPPFTNFISVQVTFNFDCSDQSITNFIIHCGEASRSYTYQFNSGLNTTATISNLVSGLRYYFAVTAQRNDGTESAYSGEWEYPEPNRPKSPYGISISQL